MNIQLFLLNPFFLVALIVATLLEYFRARFITPEYLITSFIPNRLQFQFGNTSTFIVVPIPVVIGFPQIIRSTYSDTLFPKFGRSIIFFGARRIAFGAVGRAKLSMCISIGERRCKLAMAPQSEGVIIARVLTDLPDQKMGLLSGECIRPVNEQKVSNRK